MPLRHRGRDGCPAVSAAGTFGTEPVPTARQSPPSPNHDNYDHVPEALHARYNTVRSGPVNSICFCCRPPEHVRPGLRELRAKGLIRHPERGKLLRTGE